MIFVLTSSIDGAKILEVSHCLQSQVIYLSALTFGICLGHRGWADRVGVI